MMSSKKITGIHFNTDPTHVAIYLVLLFISLNLFVASIWSMCREHYAIDPEKLQRVRSILIITTFLQLVCFSGYWLGMYIMYELCWIIWLTLSTFSIVLLGIRFGESYIILVTPNYSLTDHNKIPIKYKYLTGIFWLLGCCVDATGTILGVFFGYQQAQSFCYSIWEILCSISIGFLIYILYSVRNTFKHLNKQKIQYKQEQKKQRAQKHRIKRKKNRSKIIPEEKSENNIDEMKEQSLDIRSIKSQTSLKNNEKSYNISYTYSGSLETQSTTVTTGSINDSLLSNTSSRINSEISRMNWLIIGLFGLIFVFLLNALFNGFYRFSPHTLFSFNKSGYKDVYRETPLWVTAGIFFPQWTVINVFIMMFSWIPKYQLEDDYDD